MLSGRSPRLLSASPFLDRIHPWALLPTLLHAPFQALVIASSQPDELLDRIVSRVKAKSILHPYGFFSKGWGATELLPEFAAALSSRVKPPIQRISPSLRLVTSHSYARILEGEFECPLVSATASARHCLPAESRMASFQLLLPSAWWPEGKGSSPAGGEERNLVILLAGTGEHGFSRRRHFVAYPLARRGIATLILEGAFYGSRRPAAQAASKLLAVTDLCMLGRATIEEARTLGAWALQDLTLEALRDAAAAAAAVHRSASQVTSGREGEGGRRRRNMKFSSSASSSHSTTTFPPHRIAPKRQYNMSGEASSSAIFWPDVRNRLRSATSYTQVCRERVLDLFHGKRCRGYPSMAAAADDAGFNSNATTARMSSSGYSKRGLPTAATTPAFPSTPAFHNLVYAGTSMGGLHAAMAASLSPFPVGVASWLGPASASHVFCVGALSAGVDWEALGALSAGVNGEALETKSSRPLAAVRPLGTESSSPNAAVSPRVVPPPPSSPVHVEQTAQQQPHPETRTGEPPPLSPAAAAAAAAPPPLSPTAATATPTASEVEQHIQEMEAILRQSFASSASASASASLDWDDLSLDSEIRTRAAAAAEQRRSTYIHAISAPQLPPPPSNLAMQLQLARLLRITDLTCFNSKPVLPHAATFSRASHDLYLPRVAAEERRWEEIQRRLFPGAKVEFVKGGHVSSTLFQRQAYIDSICEVMLRVSTPPPEMIELNGKLNQVLI